MAPDDLDFYIEEEGEAILRFKVYGTFIFYFI